MERSYMKSWILAATTLVMLQGLEAREHWGPPPVCPQPKVDCCPKPKKCEQPCAPPTQRESRRVMRRKENPCKQECPKPVCEPVCPKPCEPCCPPVCFERGFPTDPCCTPTAYSEPAAIELRCGANTFITASFLYWQAIQGGMDLAIPGQATAFSSTAVTGLTQPATGRSVLVQDFEFKPGFQVGLGWISSTDHWVLYAEYTWLHASTTTSSNPPAPTETSINGVSVPANGAWIPTSWFLGSFTNSGAGNVSSKWTYGIDLVDAQLSRPFYSGARFIVEPFFGARAAFLSQKMTITANNPSHTAHYRSSSWGVGPRVGTNGEWHLGYGLRFIGDASASLLFTQYTKVTESVGTPDSGGLPVQMAFKDFNTLRPNADLSFGFGWGSYFCCRRMHFDLAATYDFSIFWEQNMMRSLADLSTNATAHPDGAASNLYLHGLTLKTRFDF